MLFDPDERTCEITTTPSFVMCTSVSNASTPSATAPLKATIVFSGKEILEPRCAIACGSLFFFARVKSAGGVLVASCHLAWSVFKIYLKGLSHRQGVQVDLQASP